VNHWWFRAECSLAALLFLAICDVALAQAGAALPRLPDLQRGQWKMSGTGDWTACGHPLDGLYSEYEQFGKLKEMGCSVNVTTPKLRTVAVAVECPKESKIGLVKSSFTYSSPNPQSFSVESVLRGKSKTLNGVRVGDC